MSVKIQVVLSEGERDQLRRQAALEGLSLSTWLKRAGLQSLERAQTVAKLDSTGPLRSSSSNAMRRNSLPSSLRLIVT